MHPPPKKERKRKPNTIRCMIFPLPVIMSVVGVNLKVIIQHNFIIEVTLCKLFKLRGTHEREEVIGQGSCRAEMKAVEPD